MESCKWNRKKVSFDANAIWIPFAAIKMEQFGCRKVGAEIDSWRDQLGQLQSAALYELTQEDFISNEI